MKYSEKLQAKIREINALEERGEFFLPATKPLVLKDTDELPRFNIHKRSLPPGMDKPICFGFTEDEARSYINNFLKAEIDSRGVVYYYDVIRDDASISERSIYYNPPGRVVF